MSRSYLVTDPKNLFTLAPHPNCLVIAAGKTGQISIHQVRALKRFLALKPFTGSKKTILIKQAQQMTRQAQNALLKTLEEPPAGSVIILTADHPDNLLPTIVSRCLSVSKRKAGKKKLETHLTTLKAGSAKQDQSVPPPTSHISLPATPTDALKLVESLAKKERPEIAQILDDWILELRVNLPQTLDQIKKIAYAKKVLRANVNKKLALESLFLDLV